MNIRKTEWAVFTTRLSGRKFDAVILGWSMGVESDPYQIWHSSQQDGGSNYIGFSNAQADEIMETARMEFDEEKRNAMYRRFHAILHEEQPYTFLYTEPRLVILDRRFHNVVMHKLGTDMRDWYVPAQLQKTY